MDEEKLVEAAMQIIIAAGDARLAVAEALGAISGADYETASGKLKLAQQKITEAHATHTDMIQCEARGEKLPYSMLFTHAQDTLMTINSELLLARQLFRMFETHEKRIAALEARLSGG